MQNLRAGLNMIIHSSVLGSGDTLHVTGVMYFVVNILDSH